MLTNGLAPAMCPRSQWILNWTWSFRAHDQIEFTNIIYTNIRRTVSTHTTSRFLTYWHRNLFGLEVFLILLYHVKRASYTLLLRLKWCARNSDESFRVFRWAHVFCSAGTEGVGGNCPQGIKHWGAKI